MPPRPRGTRGKPYRLCDKDRSWPQLSQGQTTKPYLLVYTRSRLHSVTPHVEQPKYTFAEEGAQKGLDTRTVETALGGGVLPTGKACKGDVCSSASPLLQIPTGPRGPSTMTDIGREP